MTAKKIRRVSGDALLNIIFFLERDLCVTP